VEFRSVREQALSLCLLLSLARLPSALRHVATVETVRGDPVYLTFDSTKAVHQVPPINLTSAVLLVVL